jgi:hypothetical protein
LETGHWIYPKELDINNWFGFVYRIINLTNKREYVGKKQFFSERTKIVKGRKNRKHYTKESDWKDYTGSSNELNADIEKLGKDKFIFLIESLHESRSSLFYAEVEKQIFENVLREHDENGEKKYYNKNISGVKFIPKNLTTEEIQANITSIMNEIFVEDESKWATVGLIGKDNPMYGRTGENSPRYGKNPFENLTEEQLSEVKKKLSTASSGENNPRFGKSPFENFTSEQLLEHKKRLSEAMSGENNPMYGIPCHHKMTEEEIQRWKDNISKAGKGKRKSAEARANMSKGMKGKKKSIIICPHCNKSGGSSNMRRYHFDNCKLINTPV